MPNPVDMELRKLLAELAHEWFPELRQGRVSVRVGSARTRPSCVLRRVDLDDGSTSRSVLVKTRRPAVGRDQPVRSEGRPTLLPQGARPLAQPARREYEGLKLFAEMLAVEADDRFGVVRPLAWVAGSESIVMDHVSSPTLRDVLVSASRLRPPWRRRAVDPEAFRRVGAWLRILHHVDTTLPLDARGVTRDQLVSLCWDYEAYLGQRAGARRAVTSLAASTARALADELPNVPQLVVGHGDFAARNVFADLTGRISVFDPLPRWRVPVLEDLSRFVVGVRLLGVQALTRGLALPAAQIDRIEAAVVCGYLGGERGRLRGVNAFTGLVLLDKWAAMVHKSEGDPAARARALLSGPYFVAEGERLAALLAARQPVGGRP